MTATLRKPLAPGECRLNLNGLEHPFTKHLVKIALEHPEMFGGTSEHGGETWSFRQLGRSITLRLDNPGSIVLTKPQREFLHTILDVALRDPVPFGGGGKTTSVEWFQRTVLDIRGKLPRRGAGTY